MCVCVKSLYLVVIAQNILGSLKFSFCRFLYFFPLDTHCNTGFT